ncbi:Spy/CpxP family protein refolding chaperone [Paracidovorax sp. MALMAid1276]|uniref:Spy/CpxP family protein refolding chaperone n=1 Tax=Paracidovorax sp. MALMAid1276 TaxID=3411631 RepID=UPI003B9DAB9B
MAHPLTHFHRRLAATAVLAALALPALAQTAPATAPTPATPAAAAVTAADAAPRHKMGERHHRADPAQRAEQRAKHRAERLARLKGQLQLTPAQEPAWTAFTTSMQPGERTARLDRKGMEQLTTPERIDRMRALRAQHAAEADRRGEATKAFYAALTPEQQKTFDAQTHRRGHGMGGGKHRHGPHGDHPHGQRGAHS